ncbi:MAG TPA: hypothetical protein VKA37_07960 [Halobacteriales archaeon]|nr:hypothetical protein [Halobacteriales archaeon]
MKLPALEEFARLRRGLPVLAAALLVVALFFPMWQITVLAVQYPGEPLYLQLYAYPRITGDVWEVATLNHYVGFYYPDPVYWQPNYEVHPRAIDVPEWTLGPIAFLAVAAAGAFVAVAPTVEKLKRGLRWQLVGSVTVFVVMLADIQYRLYQAGHSLDPAAPLVGVEGFTPPIWGRYEVANITSYSGLGVGAYLTMVAIALLVVAYYYRDSDATFGDVPRLVSEGVGRAIGGDGEETPGAGPTEPR